MVETFDSDRDVSSIAESQIAQSMDLSPVNGSFKASDLVENAKLPETRPKGLWMRLIRTWGKPRTAVVHRKGKKRSGLQCGGKAEDVSGLDDMQGSRQAARH